MPRPSPPSCWRWCRWGGGRGWRWFGGAEVVGSGGCACGAGGWGGVAGGWRLAARVVACVFASGVCWALHCCVTPPPQDKRPRHLPKTPLPNPPGRLPPHPRPVGVGQRAQPHKNDFGQAGGIPRQLRGAQTVFFGASGFGVVGLGSKKKVGGLPRQLRGARPALGRGTCVFIGRKWGWGGAGRRLPVGCRTRGLRFWGGRDCLQLAPSPLGFRG